MKTDLSVCTFYLDLDTYIAGYLLHNLALHYLGTEKSDFGTEAPPCMIGLHV